MAKKVLNKSIKELTKTGHWVKMKRLFDFHFVCSECGHESLGNTTNGNAVQSRYCPYCGIKMEI